MKQIWKNALIASVIVIALAASLYATYYYSFNEGKRVGFNDGLTEGQVWTLQPVQSTTIIFPNQSSSYPLTQETFLLLGPSQGSYKGVVHYGFEIWKVNTTDGNTTWAYGSNDVFQVTFESGSYVVSTGWIKASSLSAQGSLVFDVPISDTQHYNSEVLITAGNSNTYPLDLFCSTALSIGG